MYKLIETGGADAIEFLQGQLTQDLKLLAGDSQLLAAWCNPKGRVFVSLRLVRMDEATGLIVPSDMAERVVQRLTMYRLRSRVDIGQPSDDWTTFVDSDHADPGALIRAGVPTIDANNSEQFTPHMLNLDKLDAISFTKGCYTGQEVVARTEHLGKSKRRLMYYVADRDGIGVGDKLSDGDKNVGEVVNVAERGLLAVTPVELHGQILSAGNTQVVPQGLPYEV